MDILSGVLNFVFDFKAALFSLLSVGIVATLMLFIASKRHHLFWRKIKSGFSNSTYQKTAGGTTNYYFDYDLLASTPEGAELVGNWYCEAISELKLRHGPIHKLAFIEKDSGPVGALTAKDLLVFRTGIPSIVVRPLRRLINASIKVPRNYPLKNGETVVIISDVASTGAQIRKAMDKLARFEVNIPYALVIFDREEGARETLLNSPTKTKLISLGRKSAPNLIDVLKKTLQPDAALKEMVS